MITNQALAIYPFLCRISPESRRLLEASARPLTVAKGNSLLRQGDRIRGVYLVLTGRLRVYTLAQTGEEVTLYRIEPGESCPLAMNSLLVGQPVPVHQAWVGVESKTAKLLLIPTVTYRDLYENERVVKEFTLGVLSGRISELMNAMADLSLQSMKERITGHLIRLANAKGEVETTHQAIALALGTAREVVSRLIRELRQAGMIRTQRGRITLQVALKGTPAEKGQRSRSSTGRPPHLRA